MKRTVTKYPGVYQRPSEAKTYNSKPDLCYDISYKADGKKVWEKVGWASEGYSAKLAAQVRAERMRTLRHGEEVIPIQKRRKLRKTLNDVASKYFEWQGENGKPRAYTDERAYNKHIKDGLGRKVLSEIHPFLLEKFKSELKEKGLAPATIRDILGLIRVIFNAARRWGLYEHNNPCVQVHMPKVSNERVRFLSPEEARSLLEELKKRSHITYEMAFISLHAGLRFSEIARLRAKDIDMQNGMIYITQSKNGRARMVPMTDALKELFRNRNLQEPESLLFTDRKGQVLKSVSRTFDRTVEFLKLNEGIQDRRQKLIFHSLRHSCASWLVQAGVPLYTVAKILGHSSIKMVERYAHLSPEGQQAALKELEGKIWNGTPKAKLISLQEK